MGWLWHRTSRRILIFYGKGNENHALGTAFCGHKRIISAVNRAEFFSEKDVIHNIKWSLVSYYCSECPCPTRG
jgi:hypothetical protein